VEFESPPGFGRGGPGVFGDDDLQSLRFRCLASLSLRKSPSKRELRRLLWEEEEAADDTDAFRAFQPTTQEG